MKKILVITIIFVQHTHMIRLNEMSGNEKQNYSKFSIFFIIDKENHEKKRENVLMIY